MPLCVAPTSFQKFYIHLMILVWLSLLSNITDIPWRLELWPLISDKCKLFVLFYGHAKFLAFRQAKIDGALKIQVAH